MQQAKRLRRYQRNLLYSAIESIAREAGATKGESLRRQGPRQEDK